MTDSGDDILELVRTFIEAQLDASPAPRIEGVERVTVGRSRENWVFDAHWPGPEADTTAGDFGSGATVTERVEPLIVRRDPLGGLLETSRVAEFAVLQALEATAVPAPRARWLDPDGRGLGRPSLIMVREPGECDYFVLNGDRPLPERLALAERFCDLLATIHSVDWAAAGLGSFFGDPGPEASRVELDAWEAILRRDQLEPHPELEVALAWLRSGAPRSPRTVLVHGDFKPGNVLLEGDRIVALLDWELAHLGDPMEDLGWITQPLRRREHLIPGAWEQEQLFARYEAATGIAVDEHSVAWWNVLASFKTAVMQVSGLRSFVEGRSDEPYRPTAAVIGTLLDAVTPKADLTPNDDPVPAAEPPVGHLVDQHLEGARRLLEQVAAEPGLSPAGAARVADVRRLLRQAAGSWPGALRFLADDNQRLAVLLADLADVLPADTAESGADLDVAAAAENGADLDVAAAHRRNLELRARLAGAVGALADDDQGRAALTRVAAELRHRLARDPANQRPAPAAPPAPKGPA